MTFKAILETYTTFSSFLFLTDMAPVGRGGQVAAPPQMRPGPPMMGPPPGMMQGLNTLFFASSFSYAWT